MQLGLLRALLADLLSPSAVQVQSDSIQVHPDTEEEVAKVLAFASEHNLGVVPRGGGSQTYLGASVRKRDIILSLSRLNQILDYSPADLTVTVQAGTPLLALQETLNKSGQWLAVDPPLSEHATVGGLISTGASGPRRILYGGLRDQVIGMRIAYPDGRVIKTGGKVVKNVAGYDMGKLFIGALGTLGVITEATLKLRPLPSHQELVFLRPASFVDAERLQRSILDSELIPSCLELLSPSIAARLGRPESGMLLVGCDEGVQAAFYQRERLRELAGTEVVDVLQGPAVPLFWQKYRQLLSNPSERVLQVRVSLLPMQVVPFLRYVQDQAVKKHVDIDASAGLGTGLVTLFVDQQSAQDTPLLAVLQDWRERVEQKGGAFVIERAPEWVKQNLSVWGRERPEYELMRGVKRAIDPQSILNDGRFVGGI